MGGEGSCLINFAELSLFLDSYDDFGTRCTNACVCVSLMLFCFGVCERDRDRER